MDPRDCPNGRYLFSKLSDNTGATVSHSKILIEYYEEERLLTNKTEVLRIIETRCLARRTVFLGREKRFAY